MDVFLFVECFFFVGCFFFTGCIFFGWMSFSWVDVFSLAVCFSGFIYKISLHVQKFDKMYNFKCFLQNLLGI